MRNYLQIFLFAFIVGLAGCNDPKITPFQIVGFYEDNIPNAKETIQIKPNGTYIHTIELEGKKRVNSGEWYFYDRSEDYRIVFSSFEFSNMPWNVNKRSGEWPAIVEWRNRQIFIPIAVDSYPDYGFVMKKTP